MKIRKFEVSGLNERVDFSFRFHDDLNIFTGINGSGKTTALKLLWYLVSGNLSKIRNEISFSSCRMITDVFDVSLQRLSGRDIKYSFVLLNDDEPYVGTFDQAEHDEDGDVIADGEDFLSSLIRTESGNSIYFPTFRRIEGGYSISRNRSRGRYGSSIFATSGGSGVGAELDKFSKALSSEGHKFVAAVSTDDISELLTQRYAKISEVLNKKYTEFSTSILSNIKDWEVSGGEASSILLRIQSSANEVDSFREDLLRPFDVLSGLVASMFTYQGVALKGLALGDAAKAIDSDVLSAGEKQMLSFLVYNAFSENCPIFIDEPELSLHPDWQRRLFTTLLKQQSSNQFIISTHSPFIYSKFADKELRVNSELGD